MRRLPLAPGPRFALAAGAVVALDLVSKLAAAALLATTSLPLGGGARLHLVYNDTFGRGMDLGALTMPATLALSLVLLALMSRVCAPLARIDARAPLALGLLAGATAGNALDFVRTGIGAVDFISLPTATGAIVFNIADVAAYAGVALLVRTAGALVVAIAAERRTTRRRATAAVAARAARATRTVRRRVVDEVAVPVPLFADGAVADSRPRTDVPVRREGELYGLDVARPETAGAATADLRGASRR